MTPTTAPQKRSGPGAQARTEAGNFHNRVRQSTALDAYRALIGRPPSRLAANASSRLTANASSRPIDVLLSRLDNVRQYGKGYRCDCPNGHTSRGTLSLAEGNDGRVLLTCFAGCAAADVLAAVGLTLADLYPAPVRDMTPRGRARRREAMQAASVVAATSVLSFEAAVVAVAAADLARGCALAADDHDRLAQAMDCIDGARSVLDGKPIDARHYQRVAAALQRGAEQAEGAR